jgi:hypothetical protein
MPSYALISNKIPIKKVAASILSLSDKVAVFKCEKEPRLEGKLVKIFQEYSPPKGFKIEEITPDLYERAPGFEEIKALIIDKLFITQGKNQITFGLSFYDFEYLEPDFVNSLGKRIRDELKNHGIMAKFVPVRAKPYLSKTQSKKLLKEGLEIAVIKKSSPPLAIYLGKVIE